MTLTDPEQYLEVTGRIVLPPGRRPARAAIVLVQIEDTSRADAAATVLAEQRRTDVALPRRTDEIPFAVKVPAGLVDRRARYSVRAHLDVSGVGEVSKGDFVSTRSHPVLTAGHPNEVTVPVVAV
ncbi:MAG: YbaY family lipoprotein [Acidimicrobiales bacterium]